MKLAPSTCLFFALGCKAEDLGVTLPLGGVAAISMEDLQRDAWRFQEDSSGRALARRFNEVHALPAYGKTHEGRGGLTCGRRDGQGRGATVITVPEGHGAVGTAVLVSLAKAWDVPTPPAMTVIFCRVPGGNPTDLGEHPPVSAASIKLLHPVALAEGLSSDLGAVDYRSLQTAVKAEVERIKDLMAQDSR